MTNLIFNKKAFFKTIIVFLTLSTAWTILCIVTNEFTNRDKGFITGLGFLLLLPTAIYFGQDLKGLLVLSSLALLTIVTFLIGSYVLGSIVGLTTNSMVIYSIVNSFFVSITLTIFLNKIVGIELKTLTIGLTFFFLLLAYYLTDKWSDKLHVYSNFHPRLTMFNVFQFLLIIPLTLGMTLKKPAHNKGFGDMAA